MSELNKIFKKKPNKTPMLHLKLNPNKVKKSNKERMKQRMVASKKSRYTVFVEQQMKPI